MRAFAGGTSSSQRDSSPRTHRDNGKEGRAESRGLTWASGQVRGVLGVSRIIRDVEGQGQCSEIIRVTVTEVEGQGHGSGGLAADSEGQSSWPSRFSLKS